MTTEGLQPVGVLIASIISIVSGSLWFGPKTLYPVWMRARGIASGRLDKNHNPAVLFGGTFLGVFAQTVTLGVIIASLQRGNPSFTIVDGAGAGLALGVGIGVDYALYMLSVMLAQLRQGMSLSRAYYRALLFTGKVVMLTGITLSIGVVTWVASPIKFQADMWILLAFMFLWNMLGALVLLPALAHFLLRPSPRHAEDSAAFLRSI